ncbi:MAG: 4-(cytidine 5'-diphospho)-2-C-methyl-D-erythritol kinase [Lactobacillales bacterium]|jgi:4-diphosphocytidyl-2-C-methyl-D-erythritol kinase|nr:4-(cytidine 5'-diphospho)-2-C-methyl-D-erythritol kinase [Lactobacillales bacterium]
MEIIEKAPAKLNLCLNTLYPRGDGYHELEMIMTSVDLNDYLTFRKISKNEIRLSTNDYSIPLDGRNCVYQAAELLKKKFSISKGLEIEIEKNIPTAAGLGGGSSDCAATFRALNRMWNLDLNLEEMAEMGVSIGSDVPYCIYGNTAFVSGRGEKIEKIRDMKPCWVLLVKPVKGVSTRYAFMRLDNTENVNHPDIKKLRSAIEAEDFEFMCQSMGNTLEDAVKDFYPNIAKIKEHLFSLGAQGAMMSGSGSSVFGLFQNQKKALRAYNGMKGCNLNAEVYLVRSLSSSR